MLVRSQSLILHRISFSSLTQVAFGNKFFSFIYCQRDDERNLQEKKVTAYVYNHTLAKSLFRSVTEDQVFHYQNTVTPMVMNHADNRETIWRAFCRKVYNCMHQGVRGGGHYWHDMSCIDTTQEQCLKVDWFFSWFGGSNTENQPCKLVNICWKCLSLYGLEWIREEPHNHLQHDYS